MPSDMAAWTYDQAIGIIALTAVGNIKAASKCADAMLGIRDKQYKAWADGYNSQTKEVIAEAIAVGPNAWMGIAMIKLYQTTKNEKYLSAASNVGEFILKQQIISTGANTGSIQGGYSEKGKAFGWTSTEHNADAVALLAALAEATGQERYCSAAIKIAEWLHREMWDTEAGYYHPGYSDNEKLIISSFPERLDSQTWTILALHAAAKTDCDIQTADVIHNGLGWIDKYLGTMDCNSRKLVGFGKITMGDDVNPSFWSEGTAGYILAARLIGHNKKNIELSSASLRALQRPNGSVPYAIGFSLSDVTKQYSTADLLVAHFEAHPNCLFGQVGIYGDGEPNWDAITEDGFKEPYSWYYEPSKPGYNKDNVHTGLQSFRLVNAGLMCASKNKKWASFGLDLGPIINNKIKFLDVRDYQYLIFWAKTDNFAGARIKVLFRDADATSYIPQVSISPVPPQLDTKWRKYSVDLNGIHGRANLAKLVHVGLAFGKDVGNSPGTTIYVDDVAFVGLKGAAQNASQIPAPAVFPQHWPYGSVAATSWLIFAELNLNPFAID
jgi:hypothetical protein